MDTVIVTGASQNHSKTLQQFIKSFLTINKHKLVVYNLGIQEEQWENLKNTYKYPNILWKVFEYEKYPSYFDININAGEYAWKPVILYDTCVEFGNIVIWMDSGNIIFNNFQNLVDAVESNNIYTATSSFDIKTMTHPSTIDFLNARDVSNLENRNGACIGVNYNTKWARDFVNELKDCALIKNCIAPDGSDRSNHRQDQSVLSILYYKYHKIFAFNMIDNYLGYSIHNDID